MAQERIFKLGLDGDQYVSMAQKMAEEIDRLTKRQKALKDSNRGTSKEFVRNAAALKENRTSYSALQKQIIETNKVERQNADIIKEANELLNTQANSIGEAEAQTKRLNQLKKQLIVTEEGEKKLLNEINIRTDANTDFIRENSGEEEKRVLNIGNYSSALDKLSPRVSRTIKEGAAMISGLKAQRNALRASEGGLKTFRITLIGTGIGIIVIALGALVGMFLRTQKGVDALTRVLTPLKVIFQSLIGAGEKAGEAILKAVRSPKKAVDALWDSTKNLRDVLTGLVTLNFSKVSSGVKGVVSDVKEAAKNTKEFFNEAYTRGSQIADLGIKIEEQENKLIISRSESNRLIKELNKTAEDTTKTLAEREEAAKRSVAESEKLLVVEQQIIDKKIQQLELQNKSNDTSRADQRELNELIAQRNEVETQQLELQTTQTNKVNTIRNQAAAEARRFAKEQMDLAVSNLDIELQTYIENNRAKLESDAELTKAVVNGRIETFNIINQKELDALQFKFDNGLIRENEYNLAKLQLENDLAQQKKELFASFSEQEETERLEKLEIERAARQTEFELQLEENSLKRQSEYERKLEDEQLQYENDVAILNDRLLNKEISEAEHKRRLEITEKKHSKNVVKLKKDQSNSEKKIEEAKAEFKLNTAASTFGNLATILGKESKAGKAAAIAQTTIETYSAATKAYSSMSGIPIVGPVLGAIAAAAAVVAGIANIKKITSTKEPSIPKAKRGVFIKDGILRGKSHAQGGIPIEAEGGEAIINKNSMRSPFLRSLASEINVAGGGVQFAQGGFVGTPNIDAIQKNQGVTIEQINTLIDGKIANIKVINNPLETVDVANDIKQVENDASK